MKIIEADNWGTISSAMSMPTLLKDSLSIGQRNSFSKPDSHRITPRSSHMFRRPKKSQIILDNLAIKQPRDRVSTTISGKREHRSLPQPPIGKTHGHGLMKGGVL